MTAVTFDADVVVVGLGPVGAVMATLLARNGLSVLAVERNREVHPMPRAAHIDHEIMRVFQQVGIDAAILPSIRPAPPYEFRTAASETLIRIEPDPDGSPSGWAQSYMIHQPGIERALRSQLIAAGVQVRHGVAVLAVTQDDDGVTIALDNGNAVRSRYLVACDGASSGVRDALGVPSEDLHFDEPWIVVDALVDDAVLLPAVSLQICDPARPTTCVHMPAGRHRWEFMILPGEDPAAMLDDAVIHRLLAPWGAGDLTIERKALYRFHGLLAERWRVGRVLLAGDAAHQMPPFAGQGLCSGVRDAANLAWKLAAVIRDQATTAVLDSYQTERSPHVRGYVDMAIDMGRMVCTLDPVAAAARDLGMLRRRATGDQLPQLPAPAMGPGMFLVGAPAGTLFPQPWVITDDVSLRLDDVLGDGGWLIGRGSFAGMLPSMVHYFDLDRELLSPYRPVIVDWLATRGDAVLVRPDRYVFGVGDAATLVDAFGRALGAPDHRRAGA